MNRTPSDVKACNVDSSRTLHELLLLRFEPIAVKMIEDESEIPDNAVRPLRDLKTRMALCQAFSLSRREKKTVYMEKEDHWCWNPSSGSAMWNAPRVRIRSKSSVPRSVSG